MSALRQFRGKVAVVTSAGSGVGRATAEALAAGGAAAQIFIHERNGGRKVASPARRIPIGRPARPEEVTKAVLFLAGPDNTYITGENLVVDGGMSVLL